MKQIKKFCNIFSIACAITGMILLGGCESLKLNDASPAGTQPSDEQILATVTMTEMAKISAVDDPQVIAELDWLWRNGAIKREDYCRIHRQGIVFDEVGSYPAVSDIFYTRDLVQQRLTQERNDTRARHRRTGYMFSGGTLRVRIHNNVPPAWRTEIQNACSAWNALGQNVAFSYYTATDNTLRSRELDIQYTPIPSTTIAQTLSIGCSGCSSELIQINQNVYGMTNTAMRMNITHELGHAVGLHHTDTLEGLPVNGAIGCSTLPDPSSIMKTTIALNEPWTGFTSCDVSVINFYW